MMFNIGLMSHSASLGGAERMLYNCALLLKENENYNPVVFIPDNSLDDLETLCTGSGITVRRVDQSPYYLFLAENDMKNGSFFDDTINVKDKIKDVLFANRIDILICNTATSIACQLAAFESQIPVVTWIHGILDSYFLSGQYDAEKRLLFDRLIMALSAKVLFCSGWTFNYFSPYITVPAEVLFNWTERPNLKKCNIDKTNIFICLNRIEINKGVFTLLKAAKILAHLNTDFEVHFYGDGHPNIEKAMKDYVVANDLGRYVKIKKATKNVSEVYDSSFCLIQPSFVESFGMTIIEAMSYKKPVISARSGGPEEIIADGKTGFLVPKDDPEELADKMYYLLENKERAQLMGEEGYRIYDKLFSPQQAAPQIDRILRELIENGYKADENQYLIYDLLMTYLKSNSWIGTWKTKEVLDIKSRKPIDSEILCMPRMIKNKVIYYIRSDRPTLSAVGVIFTSFQDISTEGTVTLKIIYEGSILRSSVINAGEIINNTWTMFPVEKIYGCGNKVLKLVFEFQHNGSKKRFGLYEDMTKRSLCYRVCRRIGLVPKVVDVLYVDCEE